MPSHILYRLATAALIDAAKAEAIYMPCARWPAIQVVDVLETDTGLPVVASAQAFIWKGLKTAGVREAKAGSADSSKNCRLLRASVWLECRAILKDADALQSVCHNNVPIQAVF
jgi:hypothetical protein